MTITRRNPTSGQFERRHVCHSCTLLRINGIVCHETGCPEAWTDEIRKCKWCGSEFKPENCRQQCCDESCRDAFIT